MGAPSVKRRGNKNIFMNLSRDVIFNFHLGMTGGWSNQLIKHCHFKISITNTIVILLN